MVSKMLGGAARPFMETDPFSFLTFHQPLEGMTCRVLGIMARNSGLNDCSVVETNLVGLSGVHRITLVDKQHVVLFSPCRYYSSHHAGHEGEERTRGVYWGGRSGLRKYLASQVLD